MKQNLRKIILVVLGIAILYLGSDLVKKMYLKTNGDKLTQDLPELTLANLDGKDVPLNSLSEGKNLLFIYFSSECSHCVDEIKMLKKEKSSRENIDIYLISIEDARVLKKFTKRLGITKEDDLHFLVDAEWEFPLLYDVEATPSMYFYNTDGKLVSKHVGTLGMKGIQAQFN